VLSIVQKNYCGLFQIRFAWSSSFCGCQDRARHRARRLDRRSPSLEAIHRSCSNTFSGNTSILRRVERRHAATLVQPSDTPVIINNADHRIALAATSASEIGHTSHGGGDIIVADARTMGDSVLAGAAGVTFELRYLVRRDADGRATRWSAYSVTGAARDSCRRSFSPMASQ